MTNVGWFVFGFMAGFSFAFVIVMYVGREQERSPDESARSEKDS